MEVPEKFYHGHLQGGIKMASVSRIQHNIPSMNAYTNYTGNTKALSKNIEKLSSGYRVNRAADDAAGLAISEKMRAQIRGLEKAQDNANDSISLVQTAEGALTEVHSMLNRLVELATQSANGTYEDTVDRDNIQAEVEVLLDEINRIGDSTNFNGIKLLNGSCSKLQLQIGDTVDQKITVAISSMKVSNLKLSGLSLSKQASAQSAIAKITAAINQVSTQRGKLGALQNRLDHTLNNLAATTENLAAAESQIRDVDMAKEMTAYSKNNILVQAAQSMLAQANSVPQGVLQLLQ